MAHPNNIDTRGSGSTASGHASYLHHPPHAQVPQLQLYQRSTSEGRGNESWGRGYDLAGAANRRVIDWRPNLEPIPTGSGFGAPPSLISVLAPSAQDPEQHFPWNHPPTTTITGGTFIGGNVNRIQRHGEAGESS